jgi:hypothetical protein
MMGMVNWFLVMGCVVGGWAMLRIVGGEHARMIRGLERKILRDAKEAGKQSRPVEEEPIVVGSAKPATGSPMATLTPPSSEAASPAAAAVKPASSAKPASAAKPSAGAGKPKK